MNRWYRLTRTPSFLASTALGILFVGVLIAVALSHLEPKRENTFLIRYFSESGSKDQALDALIEHLKQPDLDFYEALDLLAVIAKREPVKRVFADRSVFNELALRKTALALKWDLTQKEIALALFDCVGHEGTDQNGVLQKLADQGRRHAAYALGTCFGDSHANEGAAIYFEKEAQTFDHDISRKRAVHFYMRGEKKEKLLELKNNPAYEKHFDNHTRFELAILARDLPTIIRLVLPTTFVPIERSVLVLGLITGLMWFVFSLQSSHYLTKQGLPWIWVGLFSLFLGILSIPLTHLFIALQEGWLNIKESEDPIRGVLFFFVGVGLREELAKVICFLPIIPLLQRRKELEVLVAASSVGLGFAIFENFSYYGKYGFLVAPLRFLTANFFHMAATGVAGLYLFRAFRGHESWEEFLSRFGLIILIHGGYDALLSVPLLRDYSFFATAAFIYLCYLYFHELRKLRTSGEETISLSFTFTVGVSVVLATTVIYLSELLTVGSALGLTIQTGLNLAILIFMFFRELPESLVT